MDAVTLEQAELRTRAGAVLVGPVTLHIGRGERWALLGPNGSGKTSLLALAGARRQPTTGTVTILGRRMGRVDVRELRRSIGHVSHRLSESLRPEMRVEDTVLTGTRGALESWVTAFTDDDRAVARSELERAGAAHLAERSLGTLSQGERARVLLARAQAGRPELLLLDEPAAGLDLPSREALVAALEASAAPTIVLATHHLEELPADTSHVALLRSGALVAAGQAEAMLTGEALERCFGMPIAVERRGGRWSARGLPSGITRREQEGRADPAAPAPPASDT